MTSASIFIFISLCEMRTMLAVVLISTYLRLPTDYLQIILVTLCLRLRLLYGKHFMTMDIIQHKHLYSFISTGTAAVIESALVNLHSKDVVKVF